MFKSHANHLAGVVSQLTQVQLLGHTFFNNFNLERTILQTLLTMQVSLCYSTYITILTLLTTNMGCLYREYNYLQYGLLTLLTIQYSN